MSDEHPTPTGPRGWLTRHTVDTSALRHRDFRLVFWGGTIYWLGAMFAYVALPFQIYDLTRSNFAVGALGIIEILPLVVFGLYGGALADHADRRTVLVLTSIGQVLLMGVLTFNAFLPDPQVWLIYVVGALQAVVAPLQRPAREALLPRTVDHDELASASALSSMGREVAMLFGPAVAGIALHAWSTGWAFAINTVGIVVASLFYVRLGPYPPTEPGGAPSVEGIREGLAYAVSRRDLLGTYLIDIATMIMAMPVVLWPALAQDVFREPAWLGALYSANAVGALLATATSGWTTRVHHHGRAVVLAATAWGVAIALAGLAPSIQLVLVCLVFAGAADMISGLFRSIIWNQTIPDRLRGRLAGIEMLSYSLGPMGGEARAGIVADVWSVRASITSGGIACVGAVGIVAAWLRDFWRYDARTDIHAVEERQRRAALAAGERGVGADVEASSLED